MYSNNFPIPQDNSWGKGKRLPDVDELAPIIIPGIPNAEAWIRSEDPGVSAQEFRFDILAHARY